jgi:heme-degrading monooxygenase HmoA
VVCSPARGGGAFYGEAVWTLGAGGGSDHARISPERGESHDHPSLRPTIHPGKKREFETFLRDRAIPLVSQQAGLLAQHVGRSRDPSSTEYLYVTVWEDVESIRTFAGERWQEAVITPDEEHLLRDTWIGHYEVLPTPD